MSATTSTATLTALQQALSPKAGMQRIGLPFETYQDASLPMSAKYLLNIYAEQTPADARAPFKLTATPGLTGTGWVMGSGPVTAMNGDIPGTLYVVSGDHFYRLGAPTVDGPIVIQDLGFIGGPAGADYPFDLMPTIAVGVNAVVVCVPPNAFTCGLGDTAVNQIGGDFPGARSVAYLDGYFVFTSDELSAQFFCSLLLDPSDYDALDFAFADGVPNLIRRVMVLRGELWLIGESAMEVWYDAGSSGLETTPGTSFFPFRRRAGGVVPYGTSAMKTAVICDNSLFWITNLGMVMRSQGYAAVRVSTHAIEKIIRERGGIGATTALSWTWEGHTFYAVSFPDRTLVYDCATQKWHERSTSADGAGPWMPVSVAKLNEEFVFGSALDGNLYIQSATDRHENGIDVARQVILPPLWAGTNRAFCSRVEVEMETGAGLPLDLSWSDDGGWNWTGGPRQLSTGSSARTRVYTTRLGSFRQRVFRLVGAGGYTLYAMDADITPGAS